MPAVTHTILFEQIPKESWLLTIQAARPGGEQWNAERSMTAGVYITRATPAVARRSSHRTVRDY